MTERKIRILAPSGFGGAALAIGETPTLPKAAADRLVARGRAAEIDAAVEVEVEVKAPAKRNRNRGADAVIGAPAADPIAAIAAPAVEPGAAGGDLPEIGETD